MKKLILRLLIPIVLAALVAGAWIFGPLLLVTVDETWTPMRDGVRLYARVYRPMTDRGSLSIVLMRNPYHYTLDTAFGLYARALAAHGYVVVNQDVRGTGESEGVFDPIFQERNDGYDTVEWAAAQPWSNGKVGIWGVSYLGMTAMQAAASHPPHLVAAVATATGSDYHDNWVYNNGVFDLWLAQSWVGTVLSADAMQRRWLKQGLTPREIGKRIKAWFTATQADLLRRSQQFPLTSLHELDETAPYYQEWLAHPDYDAYWARADLESQYANITVPVLSRGGWYDIFSGGTIANFVGLRSQGGSEAAKQSRLEIVPMCHGPCPSDNAVRYPFGILWALSIETQWWDYWLKGIDHGYSREPSVKLYVMMPPEHGHGGGGYWIAAEQYPLPGAQWQRWYLRGGGHANTLKGDGALEIAPPHENESADRYIYDPRKPVPTKGGKLCCTDDVLPAGVFDQSDIEQREDVLVYTSAPLQQDLSIVGPARLHFWAASSAPDTDFTAKLVDVRPDGLAINLLDSIVTARLRHGSKAQPSPIQPDLPYEYELPLGDTATVFQAGHRIRLEISSSNFPRFARNPNTGGLAASDGDLRKATQILMHDAAHLSYLELPVIPASQVALYRSAGE